MCPSGKLGQSGGIVSTVVSTLIGAMAPFFLNILGVFTFFCKCIYTFFMTLAPKSYDSFKYRYDVVPERLQDRSGYYLGPCFLTQRVQVPEEQGFRCQKTFRVSCLEPRALLLGHLDCIPRVVGFQAVGTSRPCTKSREISPGSGYPNLKP